MRPVSLGHTLELDSTVFCRYGTQEGSRKGYNSVKPGRPSHPLLLAWLSERRRVLWATLRAGHAGAANGVRGVLAQARRCSPAATASRWSGPMPGFTRPPFWRRWSGRTCRTSSWPASPVWCAGWWCSGSPTPTGGASPRALLWPTSRPRSPHGGGSSAGSSVSAKP
jgi:hypothetical protein